MGILVSISKISRQHWLLQGPDNIKLIKMYQLRTFKILLTNIERLIIGTVFIKKIIIDTSTSQNKNRSFKIKLFQNISCVYNLKQLELAWLVAWSCLHTKSVSLLSWDSSCVRINEIKFLFWHSQRNLLRYKPSLKPTGLLCLNTKN